MRVKYEMMEVDKRFNEIMETKQIILWESGTPQKMIWERGNKHMEKGN